MDVQFYDFPNVRCCDGTNQGGHYIDGSVANGSPRPYGDKVKVLDIQLDTFNRPYKSLWMWCWTRESWIRKLYAQGKEDARANIDELAKVLPRKQHANTSGKKKRIASAAAIRTTSDV